MDLQSPLLLVASGLGSGAVAGAACWWWCRRTINALRQRLELVEHARVAAVERSKQARMQIGQLKRSIADLQSSAGTAVEDRKRRLELERELGEAPTLVLPNRRLPTSGFVDTQQL